MLHIKMHIFYTADVQEAPRGTQGTQKAPGGLGSKKITNRSKKIAKPSCFTVESGATDHFACTKRARPPPSTAKTQSSTAPRWPPTNGILPPGGEETLKKPWEKQHGDTGRHLGDIWKHLVGIRYKVFGIRYKVQGLRHKV